jgi:transcriptional regulator with PAS, ATPase and Fis domain
LAESESFGHVRGAFTGATSDSPGKFELADRGTLFLDEIGDLAPALQVKFLRVLEDKKIYRVGGTKEIEVDTGVIAATNRNPIDAMEKDTFREDLYYRLKSIRIHLPPLSDRAEDIELLGRHFLKQYNELWALLATKERILGWIDNACIIRLRLDVCD